MLWPTAGEFICDLVMNPLTLCSAVFQAGGLVVVLVEVNRKAYLASIVPVIVNAILSEHQIIVDIVAFVSKGDFPRSRLGEKQRGKILAGWVTRKLRTLAQFAIRDVDPAAMGDGPDSNESRNSTGSVRSSAILAAGASSLRNVETAPQIPEDEEYGGRYNTMSTMAPPNHSMIPEDQTTPTGYPPRGPMAAPDDYQQTDRAGTGVSDYGFNGHDAAPTATFISELDSTPAMPREDSLNAPQIRLPGVDGRESLDFGGQDDEAEWTADAIMHMNLAGDMDNRRHDV